MKERTISSSETSFKLRTEKGWVGKPQDFIKKALSDIKIAIEDWLKEPETYSAQVKEPETYSAQVKEPET